MALQRAPNVPVPVLGFLSPHGHVAGDLLIPPDAPLTDRHPGLREDRLLLRELLLSRGAESKTLTTRSKDATRNKCIASSNKCLTGSNKKLLVYFYFNFNSNSFLLLPVRHLLLLTWHLLLVGTRP